MRKPAKISKKSQKASSDLDLAKSFTWITLGLLIITCLLAISGIMGFIEDNSGGAPVYLILTLLLVGVPTVTCFALWIIPLYYFFRCKKQSVAVPIRLQIAEIVNLFLIIVIVSAFVLCFPLKEKHTLALIDQKLSVIYPQEYEILETCNTSDESGNNDSLVAVKLSDYDYPFVAHINWNPSKNEKDYEDTLPTMQRGDEIPYREIVEQIFGNSADSLMLVFKPGDSSAYGSYKALSSRENAVLILVLPAEANNNRSELHSKLRDLNEQIGETLGLEDLPIDVYFVNSDTSGSAQNNVSLYNTYNYCKLSKSLLEDALAHDRVYEF